MTMDRVVRLRIPVDLDQLAALSARDQHADKATTLRQWLYQGATQYVLKLVSDGRMSVGRAAELLGQTVHDIYRLAETAGVELGATTAQRKRSHNAAAKLTANKT